MAKTLNKLKNFKKDNFVIYKNFRIVCWKPIEFFIYTRQKTVNFKKFALLTFFRLLHSTISKRSNDFYIAL